MYLTNNKNTIHNLILYSGGNYNKRNQRCKLYEPRWDYGYYYTFEPYGNIGNIFTIAHNDIEHNLSKETFGTDN